MSMPRSTFRSFPSFRSWFAACIAAIMFLSAGATAQHNPATAGDAACAAPGFGEVHHPGKTSSPGAQHMFEQGLALDYGFNHNQEEKCFRRAAKLDPTMAMAYWGFALVFGPNHNLPVGADRDHQ